MFGILLSHVLTLELPTCLPVALLHLWFCWFGLVRHEILQTPNPREWEREYRPCVTCIERNDLSFCRTVWNWSLFLAHPTCWYERVTSENTQDQSWCWFWVFKCLLQNQSLETILICNVVLGVPHNNIASIHVCDSYQHPRTSRCNRTRCGGRTCRNKRRYVHHRWVATWTQLFLLLFALVSSSPTNEEDCFIRHVWHYLCQSLRIGVWCRHAWFGFWNPDWFDRTTNQEQLCGFWKHVSL